MQVTKPVRKITIELQNEITCLISGLETEHLDMLTKKYSMFAKDHFFNPLFKMGRWDGRVRFFSRKGQTYNTLLPEIVPILGRLGYTVSTIDNRKAKFFSPPMIDKDYFSHIINPKTGEPVELRDYQVGFVNALIRDGSGIGLAATGAGKAQPLHSNVLTPMGWIPMGDVTTDTVVTTPSGKPAAVKAIYPQEPRQTYAITLDDGVVVESCAEHLWVVNHHSSYARFSRKLLSLETIMASPDQEYSIPTITPPDGYWKLDDPSSLGLRFNNMSKVEMESLLVQQDLSSLVYPCRLRLALSIASYGSIRVYNYAQAQSLSDLFRSLAFRAVVHDSNDKIQPYEIHVCTRACEYRKIVSIVPTTIQPVQCISVDSDEGEYITDGYTRTHNTFMCAAITKSYADVGATSAIIVPSASLVTQTRREFDMLEIDTGEYSGKTKLVNGKDIIVTTWQALKNNPAVASRRDLILVDETHGARGQVLQSLMTDSFSNIPHRMGVTGTLPEHPTERMSVITAIGEVVADIPASELIANGVLASLHISIIQLQEDLTNDYNEFVRLNPDTDVTYDTFKAKFFADFSAEKRFLARNTARLEHIANNVSQWSANGNVLCLVQGVKTGKDLANMVPGAHFVHGANDTEVREQIYALFEGNNDVVVFATYGVCSTGISIDRVFELVLVDAGKSFIRVIQSIGRGLRKSDDKSHVNVRDVCSDLTHSKKHLTTRKRMYKSAEYPFSVTKQLYKPVEETAVAESLLTM